MKISQSALKNIIAEELQALILESFPSMTAGELAALQGRPIGTGRFQGEREDQTPVRTYIQDPEANELVQRILRLGDMDKIKNLIRALDRVLQRISINIEDVSPGGGGLEIPYTGAYEE